MHVFGSSTNPRHHANPGPRASATTSGEQRAAEKRPNSGGAPLPPPPVSNGLLAVKKVHVESRMRAVMGYASARGEIAAK